MILHLWLFLHLWLTCYDICGYFDICGYNVFTFVVIFTFVVDFYICGLYTVFLKTSNRLIPLCLSKRSSKVSLQQHRIRIICLSLHYYVEFDLALGGVLGWRMRYSFVGCPVLGPACSLLETASLSLQCTVVESRSIPRWKLLEPSILPNGACVHTVVTSTLFRHRWMEFHLGHLIPAVHAYIDVV